MEKRSPNKSVLKKALHINHHDSRPLAISNKLITVDDKFLTKPQPFNNYQPSKPATRDAPDMPSHTPSVLCTPEIPPPTWTPIDFEDQPDLIPLPLDNNHECPLHPQEDLPPPLNQQPVSPARSISFNRTIDSDLSSPCSRSHYGQSSVDESSLSDASTASVVLFDNLDNLHLPERLNQSRRPVVGDYISYFDDTTSRWVNAVITHDLSRRYPDYFNIIIENGPPAGLYLIPDTRWTLRSAPAQDPLEEDRDHNASLPSLRPSPELSLIQVPLHENDSDMSHYAIAESPRISLSSLEWDYSASQTPEFYDIPLNRVGLFNDVLPIHEHDLDVVPHDEDLLHVQIMSHRLPLSSTPQPQPDRISRLRQPLPLEREPRSLSLPNFFRRHLNIFRRRN